MKKGIVFLVVVFALGALPALADEGNPAIEPRPCGSCGPCEICTIDYTCAPSPNCGNGGGSWGQPCSSDSQCNENGSTGNCCYPTGCDACNWNFGLTPSPGGGSSASLDLPSFGWSAVLGAAGGC